MAWRSTLSDHDGDSVVHGALLPYSGAIRRPGNCFADETTSNRRAAGESGEGVSADNWATCPRCKDSARKQADKRRAEVEAQYGQVPAGEYGELIEALENDESSAPHNETLREDYEIGMDASGEFFVGYGCSCQKCDFKYAYRYTARPPVRVLIEKGQP